MTVTSVDVYIRGETVEVEATFTDKDGDTLTPSSVTMYFKYCDSGVDTTATVTLTLSSGVWTGSWDSAPADEGTIYWHLRTAGSTKAAEDGHFTLKANDANPET